MCVMTSSGRPSEVEKVRNGIFQACQAASIGADPERILVVFLKRPDFVVFQASGFHGERRETAPVKRTAPPSVPNQM